jgi:poly-gamma-glutamate synthesis protein (capsule biosynthesis protein)
MDEHTHQVFEAFWGPASSGVVSILPADKLLNQAWKNRPSWAIIPFEALRPRWKVLEIDGQSPVRADFNPASYPLVVPFSLVGNQDEDGVREQVAQGLPATNRDSHKLTTVILTGVTAMVRATAYLMERDGITNPAQDIGEWLRSADITHISNEIPFAASCPFPNPQQADLRFCSSPRYIGLLEDIGTDIVELTGDHFADWGSDATLYTLEMYRDRGWLYYGGGENLAEGRKAVRLDHNGNRIAFIGCNAKGGGYATASGTRPGAVPCDFNWMEGEIRRLKEKGVLVIATFQHQEIYSYSVSPGVREDFVRLAEAGADIVSGSQAHQPQGMEFVDGSFLHFGLGNLFFDQYRYFAGPETDQAFIDRHVFYDGRYIATELLTTQFVNLARSRPMTPEEREEFLSRIFTASGW